MFTRLALLLSTVLLCLASFGWGVFTHRNKIFPYALLKSVAPTEPRLRPAITNRSGALRELATMGYVDAAFDPNQTNSGVLTFDSERASVGFSIYGSRTSQSAQLIDMKGRVLREWAYPTVGKWQHVHPLDDGSLLVVISKNAVHKIDLRSNLLWSAQGAFHHDLAVDVIRSEVLALDREYQTEPNALARGHGQVIDDLITVLDLDTGELKESFSLLDSVASSPYSYLLQSRDPNEHEPSLYVDLLHTNHVEIIGRDHSTVDAMAAGNLLISSRTINSILVLDRETKDLLWLWGPGNLTFQHHPTMLDNGNLLIFDNGPNESVGSRVIELDPATLQIVWSYAASGFFSATRGSAQRLPNGNTLITESDTGYVFEVTPGGDVVWEFANPDISQEGARSTIWRMLRYEAEELPFLPERLDPLGADVSKSATR